MAQEPFGDIPLFREIQKILASSEGPFNLEIARQVGNAIATQGLSDTSVPGEVTRSLEQAARDAERLVAGYSRLSFDEPAQIEAGGRGRWVTETLHGWRWLLDHLARHFTAELARSELGPSEDQKALQSALGQLAPLLIGVQAGTLVGHLARAALARYDYAIPRDGDSKLIFVATNLEELQRDYELSQVSLHRWLVTREVTHHAVVGAAGWINNYWRSLLVEVVDATEIDTTDLERRLMDLQTKGMDALQRAGEAENALPVVSTERHRQALERLRAFAATIEGYTAHVSEAVATELVDDRARTAETMARYRAAHREAQELLATVLGISLEKDLEPAGRTFCAAVVQLKGILQLNRIWEAPDNLPTMPEIKDPFSWMERVLEN
jgi:putative hydrolase